ncbi:MAG: DUF4190 domain-containing protein [Phycisphaerales bacterium]|nr:DUF4190 domain-containing protein [Phycisphaerales bacterium]
MTQMQSPYHEESDVKLYQEPDRTSIMAILSMVFGIGGCCLGLTSIPAILLGVFGLVGISRSKGRVGGSGFGIAGILIGLLTLALWVGLIFGGSSFLTKMMSNFGTTTEQVFLDIQADGFDTARSVMQSPASDASDAELIAFREAYRSTLGDFVSMPSGFGEIWSGYGAVINLFQPYNGQQGYIPLPMRFDSGWALVIYVMDVQGQSSGFPPPIKYILIDSQGNEYHLPGTNVIDAELDDVLETEIETDLDIEEPVDPEIPDLVPEAGSDDGP